jgi:hypothetical protein
MREAKKQEALPAATEEAPPRRNRRQALALAGAAAAAATVAALGVDRGNKAHAAPGDPLILGLVFNDGGTEATGLTAAVKGPSPPGPVFQPDFTLGVTNTAPTPGPDETTHAVSARGYGTGVGGYTTGDGPHSFGVFGASVIPGPPGEPDLGWGPAPGVAGASGTGPGVIGDSESGPGVKGHCSSNQAFGVVGESPGGGVHGVALGKAWGVLGESWSRGVEGRGYHGVIGEGYSGEGGAAGVLGTAPGDAPGVRAASQLPGMETPDGGLALDVVGKARFSTAGAGIVRARANAATIENPAVTADSHITVTFTGDPGAASVAWVERQPGTGFIARLSSRPRWDVPFTYLIVEPSM